MDYNLNKIDPDKGGNYQTYSNEGLLEAYFEAVPHSIGVRPGLVDYILKTIDISRFADLDYQQLKELMLDDNQIASILTIIELTKRSLKSNLKSMMVTSSNQLARKLQGELGAEKQEVLKAIYLDNSNRIIEEREIFRGSSNKSLATPKEILHYACKNMAASVILAHNHPSGSVRPSQTDDVTTRNIKNACDALEIVLLDHIIVSKDSYYSYREETNVL